MKTTNAWASDVPVSMPQPYRPDMPVLVDMGGFGFTEGGIAHNLSAADAEAMALPFFAPDGASPR